MPVQILIAERHTLLSQSLAEALRHDGYDVHRIAPATAEKALKETRTLQPAVVLVDLQLGQTATSGIGLIGPLRAAGASVVVMMPDEDRAQLERCLQEGAASVVSKTDSFDHLVAGVQEAADVATLVPRKAREQLIEELRQQRKRPTGGDGVGAASGPTPASRSRAAKSK